MTGERWQAIQDVFALAADLGGAEREAFLTERCGGDTELRREVESLLEFDDASRVPLTAVVGAAAASLTSGPPPADAGEGVLGPWRLIREIGRGGMGTVWLAERTDGAFVRTVAVKRLTSSSAGPSLEARFDRERQILASLVHPNIARLLDGGTDGEGRPYLVMEYVQGTPLTVFARERRLSVRAVLELFLTVCEAVAHAHRKLVVHRDLKPGNCLVTADGVPKLLDFGIAKVLSDDEGWTLTQDALLFTPDYASPEQVRGEPITTASDVYALGLILFELLTGEKGQSVTAVTPLALQRAVCEREVPRPSVQAPKDRARELRGDLDAIVARALRKEPEQRYGSVPALAEDVRRHLAQEPVLARKGTWTYRATRFARRNVTWVVATSVILASLIAGVVFATLEARARDREARRAERRFAEARKLATSFLFDVHDRIRSIPGTAGARAHVLAKALEHLRDLEGDAEDDGSLRRELAEAYVRAARILGAPSDADTRQLARAVDSLRRAVRLVESLPERGDDASLGVLADTARQLLATFEERLPHAPPPPDAVDPVPLKR